MPIIYWIYDIETYPNAFTFSIVSADRKISRKFQCSTVANDFENIMKCMDYLHDNDHRMVGFNNQGFDYPVMHDILQARQHLSTASGERIAKIVYNFAQEQIATSRDGGFPRVIKDDEQYVKQVDLFKIHHFDNKAKTTSLKLLEFNMRSETIEDLPYAIGQTLTPEEIENLLEYNMHDVSKTADFFDISKPMITFREELTEKYGRNFMNHNDTKIGKDYFIMRLEEAGIRTSRMEKGKRVLNQTKRGVIKIEQALFDYYDFKRPEFQAILDWFKRQRIVETKGVFTELDKADLGDVSKYANMRIRRVKIKCSNDGPTDQELKPYLNEHPFGYVVQEKLKATLKGKIPKYSYWFNWEEADVLNVVINGFQFDFGVGGIHGSLSEQVIVNDDEYEIVDADVASMYPNLGISNRVYPEHLSPTFCDIYLDVYEQRKSYKKGTAENAMLKLALNGVYGDSNNKFSPFYDPMYTMKITINGQLSLCLLAEDLITIPDLQIIQINTDGITVKLKRKDRELYNEICRNWQKKVKLELEFAEYRKMIIRDVNNYYAVYVDGKVKRKGAYQYKDLEWHKNQGGLVIKKAAEAAMVHDVNIEQFIREHKDPFDFCFRAKIPKSSRLQLETESWVEGEPVIVEPQQNICRYYVSNKGGNLIKIMPPLESKPENGERRFIQAGGKKVKTCNNMKDFSWDIDYSFYVEEAKKLVIGKRSEIDEDSEESNE